MAEVFLRSAASLAIAAFDPTPFGEALALGLFGLAAAAAFATLGAAFGVAFLGAALAAVAVRARRRWTFGSFV
ncbi:MAG TPA: hypothetical protein VF449_02885 [Parvibaculum sp.]